MKASLTVFVLFFFSIVILGCASHEKKLMESNAKYYDQADLEMFFSKNRSGNFVTAKGAKGMLYYYPNRTVHIEVNNREDDGEYSLKDGKICSTWKTIRKGERCTKLYQVGDKVFEYVTANGAYDSTVTFVE